MQMLGSELMNVFWFSAFCMTIQYAMIKLLDKPSRKLKDLHKVRNKYNFYFLLEILKEKEKD